MASHIGGFWDWEKRENFDQQMKPQRQNIVHQIIPFLIQDRQAYIHDRQEHIQDRQIAIYKFKIDNLHS